MSGDYSCGGAGGHAAGCGAVADANVPGTSLAGEPNSMQYLPALAPVVSTTPMLPCEASSSVKPMSAPRHVALRATGLNETLWQVPVGSAYR